MTFDEWRADQTLAPRLKEALANPIIQLAFSVLNELTAAKTLGNTSSLSTLGNNAITLFGYDSGRASIFMDLHTLSTTPDPIEELQSNYTSEF